MLVLFYGFVISDRVRVRFSVFLENVKINCNVFSIEIVKFAEFAVFWKQFSACCL
jgi:hypothetical protein